MIGKLISHYKILEQLGGGGMGVVYKAQDLKLDRPVALKFLPPSLTRDPEAKQRFVHEAKAASALDHANICNVHTIGETDDGQIFIVMACYEGETLREKISRKPLGFEEAAAITLQIAQGLVMAHAKGIIHRDIKPANILITTDGIAKILDFGLAKLAGQIGVTKTGSTVGTFAYMSPEQVRGDEVDHRTDLWSVGATLYEMLVGNSPFRGEHEAALVYEILNTNPRPLRQSRPDVPEHLQVLVSRLLQKDPTRRISSAEILIQDLSRPPNPVPDPSKENSIAVLYFENMSSEHDTDYFCAGITEDIITDLSRIKSLRVVPRNDVLPFRNKDTNIRRLGEDLRANFVLEGSVRKAANRIRITAQLTDVRSGYHIWAERFDRLLEDIFDLQNEVSGRIVDALRVSLTETEKALLTRRPTDDLRAYDFYMRGKDLVSHRGRRNAELAIQMLERAISIDPDFVGALSGLAEACSHMYTWYDGDQKWLDRIIELSERALALDPELLEARLAYGTVYVHQKRLGEAKRVFEKLVQNNPDFYEGFLWLGMVCDLTGEYDEAIRSYIRASEVKPYSEEPLVRLDMTYRRQGNKKLSEATAHMGLAIGIRRLALNPDDTITRSRVATYYALFQQRENAITEVRKIHAADPTDSHAHYNAACALAALKEKGEMLEYLRIAFEGGAGFRAWVKNDPDFEAYRKDPDFQRLIEEFE
jgi:serine/threonine protein kinase/tetratricopeptide (TPR) repeat protein